VINPINDARARIVETVNGWRVIQMDFAVTLTVAGRVQVLTGTGKKAVYFGLPINVA
jgi:hypothetical protein